MRLAVALALCLAACSVDPLPLPDSGPDTGSGRVCVPGAQVACACVGGGAGAQVCRADGSGYEACGCPDAGSPVDSGRVDSGTDTGAMDTGARDVGVDVVPVDTGADVPRDEGADVVDASDVVDVPECRVGETLCAGSCVDTLRSVIHCGRCNYACPGGANATGRSCRDGMCRLTCIAPYADCDGRISNGCEANTFLHMTNCGRCGNVCPTTMPTCCRGECRLSCS